MLNYLFGWFIRVDRNLAALLIEERLMSEKMDALIAETAKIHDVAEATKVAISGLRQQIIDAGTDPVQLQAVIDSLKTDEAGLTAAITTPPVPTP